MADDFIGVTQNLRVVKERYMFVWLAESMVLSELGSSTGEILNACEDDRVLECENR